MLCKPNAKWAGEEFFPEAFATHIFFLKNLFFCMKKASVLATVAIFRQCSSEETSGAENVKREKMCFMAETGGRQSVTHNL